MTFEEFTSAFLKWSEEHIESKKSDGFAVCPYAKHARINKKVQFIDARDSHGLIPMLETFNKDIYEIGVAWLGDVDADYISKVEDIISDLHKKYPDLLYFTSTRESGHFVKNFSDCVFIQLRDDILEKREQLHKTKYYDSWPEHYYKIITGNV
jgi:hypothetical protein